MILFNESTLSTVTPLFVASVLYGAPQDQAPPIVESPVRKAFIASDVSLTNVARESRSNEVVSNPVAAPDFSFEQPPPGRAAAMRSQGGELYAIDTGLFTPIPMKTWHEHDQVTIVVLEASRVERSQELQTDKSWDLALEVAAWTDFFNAGNLFTANGGNNLPRFEFAGVKGFDGEGDYGSEEEITFRTTATVLEVLPNGNLVLQARHTTKTDNETTAKTTTGSLDPRHIAPDDTILHWRLYDLDLNIQNSGMVKEAATKGIVAQILDVIFAF